MEINLGSLNVQQLGGLKKQIEEELEHFSSSFTQLAAIQSRFRQCLQCLEKNTGYETSALVPLTASLYVRGNLSSPDKVIVDIGTGFFVERDSTSAIEFYKHKIEDITTNIKNLEEMVSKKSGSLRHVEDALRQKLAIPIES